MKKVMMSLIIVAVCFLAAGCGTKLTKVTCSTTTSGININMNFTYNDSKGMYLEKGSMHATLDLSSYTDAQRDAVRQQDLCSTFINNLGSLKPAFTGCKQEVTGKELILTSDVNLKTAQDKNLFKLKMDKKDVEKYFDGYTCTYK